MFRGKRNLLVILVLLLALLFTACGEEEAEETTQEAVAVDVAVAQRSTITNYITTSGDIEPIRSAYLIPQVQGEIKEVAVELGQEVAKGDKLLEVDGEMIALDLKQAKARLGAAEADLERTLAGARKEDLEQMETALKQAEIRFEQTERDFSRQQELYQKDAISKQRFEMAKLEYEAAKADKESARLSLKVAKDGAREEEIRAVKANTEQARLGIEAAQLQLERSVLKAPYSGVISQVNAKQGQLTGSEPAFQIVDLERVKIKTYYSENYISNINQGDEVLIEVNALNKEFTGNIANISPVTDPRTKTYLAEIVVDNPQREIRGGMYAKVRTVREQAKDEIVIPQSAVFLDEGQEYVMVVEDDIVIKKEVETGLSTGEEVIIYSGIEVGQEVVTIGQERLTPEDKVRVVNRGDQ